MFCDTENKSSQASTVPECSETNKNKVSLGSNVRNEQTGVKSYRIPFRRRNKEKSKAKKSKSNLISMCITGILLERNKENIPYPLARNDTHSDITKSFINAQWPKLKSPSKFKKGHGDNKSKLLCSETQTDVFNIAEMYPLWNTREIVPQISDNVSFLRQNRTTQGTQTEDLSITKENNSACLSSDSTACLTGMTLAQIQKTYADVVQQENARIEKETKPMTDEASTEPKTFLKLKGTKRHSMHKQSHKSSEPSPQKAEIHPQLEGNEIHYTMVDITEIHLSTNDKDEADDPENFKSLLMMLTGQNEGLKINLLHENQSDLLYILNSAENVIPEPSSYDISARTRNYFILHADNCMLNCTTADQLMYGYSFQEGTRHQINLYNQSLQTRNIANLTIIDSELLELSCHKLRRTASSYYQEINKFEDQGFQQNGDINKEGAFTDGVQLNEYLQYPYYMMVEDTAERQPDLQENDMYPEPEVIATEGLDPIFAFYLALEFWGGNKPRMPYTKMLRPNILQNKFSGMPCREIAYGEEDECSVPKWLIVPLQKEHQFLLDAVNEEQPQVCAVYYESQTCKSSRYTVEIQNSYLR